MNRRQALGCLTAGAIGIGLGCGKSSAPGTASPDKRRKIRLTLPHSLSREHPTSKAIDRFAEAVSQKTVGEMEVRVYSGSTIGNEDDFVKEVALGNHSMTKISASMLSNTAQLGEIFSLPYLFRDDAHLWKALDASIGHELMDKTIDAKLKGLCYFSAGFRSFYTKSRQVRTPDDLKGMTVRVQASKIMTRLIQALGAIPSPLGFRDVYDALKGGQVDGAENNIPSYYSERHFEQAPFFSFDEHVTTPDLLLVNADVWRGLGLPFQKAIQESAAEASLYQRKIWDQSVKDSMEAMIKSGVVFLQPDKQAFAAKVRDFYKEYDGAAVMDYIERIQSL